MNELLNTIFNSLIYQVFIFVSISVIKFMLNKDGKDNWSKLLCQVSLISVFVLSSLLCIYINFGSLLSISNPLIDYVLNYISNFLIKSEITSSISKDIFLFIEILLVFSKIIKNIKILKINSINSFSKKEYKIKQLFSNNKSTYCNNKYSLNYSTLLI